LSHPQALAQCRIWLAENLPSRNLIPMPSTAAAAMRAREEAGTAAVGSSMLADLCGLDVLAQDIQDHSLNQTRFLVVAHELSSPTGQDKTSILFSTPHSPGALLHTLVPFAEHGINLTKIESRPAKNLPWNYIFFVDFEGHLEDERVKSALEALKPCVNKLKILGSYPAGRLVQESSETRRDQWPECSPDPYSRG
ncbi:MAG: ACT domain-containing protein, partial [Deltaproteobacteria bacterium]|nr:ACT domain-containing protein [Deltaproteobacteria bacterium]